VGTRLQKEGLAHHGFDLAFAGEILNINLQKLTGKHVTVYGQTEVTKDLANARSQAGLTTIYSAENVRVSNFDTQNPLVEYEIEGKTQQIQCEFIAGCDGYHGVCRASIPKELFKNLKESILLAG
jgi:p-hydroxybenzoate 3-monooxygenase